jgi:hypothetical protein
MIQGEDHPCNSPMFLPSSAQGVGLEVILQTSIQVVFGSNLGWNISYPD